MFPPHTVPLWPAIGVSLWFAAGPVRRRPNLTAVPDHAIVAMVLDFFGLIVGLFAMEAISA